MGFIRRTFLKGFLGIPAAVALTKVPDTTPSEAQEKPVDVSKAVSVDFVSDPIRPAFTVEDIDEVLDGLEIPITTRITIKNRLLEKGMMEFGGLYWYDKPPAPTDTIRALYDKKLRWHLVRVNEHDSVYVQR